MNMIFIRKRNILFVLAITCLLLVGCNTTVMEPIQPGIAELAFSLSQPGTVTLTIENSYNEVIKVFYDNIQLPVGNYTARWNILDEDRNEIVEGVYYWHIIIEFSKGRSERIIRMILINP